MSDQEHSADGCVFCAILEGRLPASFVYRSERCAAFMDLQPVNPGHLLVVPLEHVAELSALPGEVAAELMTVAQRMTRALYASGLRCEGVNLLLADGAAAMQEVFHVHLHVFPRFRGDGFGLRFGPAYSKRPRAELDQAAGMLREALSGPDQAADPVA